MANSTPSNPGYKAGDTAGTNDLLLDIFGGEVQAAYERMTIMRDKHRVFAGQRQIAALPPRRPRNRVLPHARH